MSHHLKLLLTSHKVKRDPNVRFSQVLPFLLTIGIIMSTSSLVASQDRVSSTSEQSSPEEHIREPDKPTEGELTVGSYHSYSVVLTSGQSLHVMVQPGETDLVVTLRDPIRTVLSEMDRLQSGSGMEELFYEAAGKGQYVVEVRAKRQFPHYQEDLRTVLPANQDLRSTYFATNFWHFEAQRGQLRPLRQKKKRQEPFSTS